RRSTVHFSHSGTTSAPGRYRRRTGTADARGIPGTRGAAVPTGSAPSLSRGGRCATPVWSSSPPYRRGLGDRRLGERPRRRRPLSSIQHDDHAGQDADAAVRTPHDGRPRGVPHAQVTIAPSTERSPVDIDNVQTMFVLVPAFMGLIVLLILLSGVRDLVQIGRAHV